MSDGAHAEPRLVPHELDLGGDPRGALLSRDGRVALTTTWTGSFCSTVRTWDALTGVALAVVEVDTGLFATPVRFSGDGTAFLVVESTADPLRVYNAESGVLMRSVEVRWPLSDEDTRLRACLLYTSPSPRD